MNKFLSQVLVLGLDKKLERIIIKVDIVTYRCLDAPIYVYAAIRTAKGEPRRQARCFGNPDQCSNWTAECAGEDLDFLARQKIPNDDLSIITYISISE